MADPFIVSRRKAAIFIAGTLAASTGPAHAASLVRTDVALPMELNDCETLADGHRHIAGLLQNVRRATGAAGRAEAFERCKIALRVHDLSEVSMAASQDAGAGGAHAGESTLYRYVDPSTVLARVLVRELTAWPKTDAGWLERFADLEAAFQSHVAEQERDEGYNGRLERRLVNHMGTRSRGEDTGRSLYTTG